MTAPQPPALALDTEAAAEFAVLTTEPGRRLLGMVAKVTRPGPAALIRWRQSAPADLVAAAVRIAESRRRGASKFSHGDRMWFSAQGLEQATAELVARHKARRFAAAGADAVVVDLCAGIGGDSLALGAASRVIAVDLAPGMSARVAWNTQIHDVADRVEAVTARAEDFAIPPDAWVHVDPDRRVASVRKTNDLADYAPGLGFLHDLVRTVRGGAIKLGPASDFAAQFGEVGCEIEVVSLRGECKEATVWFGDRVTPGVRRRATALPSATTWTDQDGGGLSQERGVATPVDRWVGDPDPALVRSGLLDGFARAHGWTRFEPEIDLLTGPERSFSPLVTSFEVVEVFPLDLKILRQEVTKRALGPLEIKTRGLTTRPEAYRTQLRPPGPNPATWFLIAGHDGPGRAILARRP